jgi:hypothetical protein
MRAGWNTTTGFSLALTCPAIPNLSLGNGVTTEAFELLILTNPPALCVDTKIKVPVHGQTDPLEFIVMIKLDELTAAVSGEMKGWWTDPFGVSNRVKIGPDLALGFQIIYEDALPSGVGFSGGLMIGNVAASIAVGISVRIRWVST